MTPENFCYWLQGLLEVGEVETLNEKQVQQIKDHINLVFEKKTPNRTEIDVHPVHTIKKEDFDRLVPQPLITPDPLKDYTITCSATRPEVKAC